MKKFLLAFALSGSLAHAQDIKPPPVPQAPEVQKPFVSQGDRVTIEGAGFSMQPPVGWEVQPQMETGTSLLFQAPKPPASTKEFTYQANIRVMTFFDDPTAIDDIAKEEWSKIITEKMGNISNRTDDFALLSAEKVKLQSGVDAILFYSSFKYDSVQMMQMHILVSNAKNSFLMTYTDLGKVFEAQEAALTTAYTAMHSAQLDSVPAPRFQKLIMIGGAVAGLLVFLLMVRIIRSRRVAKMGDGLDDDSGADTTSYTSSVSMVTDVDRSSSRRRSRDDDEDFEEKPKKKARHVEEDVEEENPVSVAVSMHEADVPTAKRATPPMPSAKKAVNAPVPKAPAPQSHGFENRKRKEPMIQTSQHSMMPESNVAVSEVPVSEVADWNVSEAAPEDDVPLSTVMPAAPKSSSGQFAKKEKTKSSTMSRQEVSRVDESDDDTVDESEVARLSEILPRDAETEKPKKKGFFGWGGGKEKKVEEKKSKKSKSRDDDDAPVSAVSDAWAVENKKSVGKSKKDSQPVSEVAHSEVWALNGSSSSNVSDDEED